jgi:hypothetical protein
MGILCDVIHMGYIYISTWGYYQIPELSC